MRRILISLAAIALLLVGCGAPAPADPPAAAAPPPDDGGAGRFSSDTVGPDWAPGAATSRATVSPLPPRPPLYPMTAPPLSEGPIGAVPNPGPVTGYGPGGFGHIPGSPPNPPYH